MKKIILSLAFAGMIFGANAQKIDGVNGKTVKGVKLAPTTTKVTCDTLDHIGTDTLTIYVTASGYLFGNNEYNTASNGEFFTYTGTGTQLNEMYVYFGAAYDGGNGSNVSFNVYTPLNDTTPGTLLGSQNVALTQIVADVDSGFLTHVVFDTPASISGNFIITIDNPTGTNDTIGIVTNIDGNSSAPDYSLINYGGTWYSTAYLAGINVSLAVWPIVCDGNVDANSAELSNIVVFPTLTTGKVLFGGLESANISVYDVTGNRVASFNNVSKYINISNLNNGIYILRIEENGKVLNKKVVLQK